MRQLRMLWIAVTALALGGALGACCGSAEAPGAGMAAATSVEKVNVRLIDQDGKPTEVISVEKVVKSDAEWKRILTPEQYRIARGQGTEPAFCGGLLNNKEPGVYSCVCCGLPLFSSATKFESGTGWPSFYQPFAPQNIVEREDRSLGLVRTEILCARCDAHLGHVFSDGPKPTGLRYCLNSVVLTFTPQAKLEAGEARGVAQVQKATFAAGCFWHVEQTFREVPGVLDTQVGYTGGTAPHPTYKEVCSDRTGHAEAVEVSFDASRVSYGDLLAVFWKNHDPTTPDRQGPDVGTQYRSAIFYHTPEQQAEAQAAKAQLEQSGAYSRPIVTQIVPATTFWRAEEYHQRYLEKQGLSSCDVR